MKTKIFILSLFLSLAPVFWAAPSCPQVPADPGMAAVSKDALPVYSANSPGADIVKVLSKGDPVRVRMSLIGSEGAWCLISEEGKTETLGYVSCGDLGYPQEESTKSQASAEPPNRPAPSPEITGEMPGTQPSDPADPGVISQAGLGSLLQAVWKEDISAVKELLATGVNPNARTIMGASPLHGAVKKDEAEITRALIAYGADVNAKDVNGLTPLMAAASVGQTKNIEALLAAGARIDDRDDKGFTALMWAVIQGSPQGVENLLEKNAEVNARSKEGGTTLWLSKQTLSNTRKSLANAFRKNSEELIRDLKNKLAKYEEIFQMLRGSGGKE
jgi:ankyrin repeat protein